MKEYGDVSLTDRIFKTLGRIRLYAEKILPEIRSNCTGITEFLQGKETTGFHRRLYRTSERILFD